MCIPSDSIVTGIFKSLSTNVCYFTAQAVVGFKLIIHTLGAKHYVDTYTYMYMGC